MKSPVFARVRKEVVAAVVLAAGSTSLVACSSSEANYRPAPNYTQPAARTAAPVYTPPAATPPASTPPASTPQYAPPAAPAPAPSATKPGGFACGKGKCG